MRRTRTIVVVSFLLSAAIVGIALFSSSPMQSTVAHQAPAEWLRGLPIAFLILAVCGWPWLKAWSLASRPEETMRSVSFSVVAVVISAAFYLPIVRAPAEGIGYYIIICVLLVWLAYPVSKVFSL